MRVIYTLLVGFPLCVGLMMVGCLFCLTIVGIPLGLACFALAAHVVALKR